MKIFKRVALTTLIFLTTAVLSIAYFIRSPVIGQYAFKENIIRSDQKSLLQHVRFLSELNPVRNYQEHDSIEAAKKYIASEFSEYGYEVEMQDIHSKENSFYNVIARYGEGQGPLVVVGAHYDVAGEGNPGADDNASGVAGLLEIARMLQANKPKFEFPVELVAYTLEEPPFFAGDGMGSAFHAKALNEQGKSVKLMYSLEMIGYFSEEMFSQLYPVPLLFLIYPWVGDFIAIVGGMQDRKLLKNLKKSFNGVESLKTYSINAPSALQGVDFSDHRNYWQYDWPAVMITDTAFFRNDQYHKSGDTADRLNFEKMSLVVDGVYNSLLNLDRQR